MNESLINNASYIRKRIIDAVRINGGHIGSSLGVVDLSVALNHVFCFKDNRIIWDIGHQSYAYKIMTGRDIVGIRSNNRCSPFTDIRESEFDHFGGGHSSTSISAAIGMYKNDGKYTIAVIGDAALSAGLAIEALNNIKRIHKNLILIVNDNGMSIAPSSGNIHQCLRCPEQSRDFFNVFQLQYHGFIDGHDIAGMIDVFNDVKSNNSPTVIHIKTQKGYKFPDTDLHYDKLHSIPPLNGSLSFIKQENPNTYQNRIAGALLKYMDNDDAINVVTPAMALGSCLMNINSRYPNRIFDVAIAEQHAVTFACGLAKAGKVPCVFIYSTFLQRAYDQIIHDVICQGLPVKLFVDRAGFAGGDGVTHHGLYDISMALVLPNISIYSPFFIEDLDYAISMVMEDENCSMVRYPKGVPISNNINHPVNRDIYECCKDDDCYDICIISYGTGMQIALSVYEELKNSDISISVFNLVKIKPMDWDKVNEIVSKFEHVIFIDESMGGALAKSVKARIAEIHAFYIKPMLIYHKTVHEQRCDAGIDVNSIKRYIQLLTHKSQSIYDYNHSTLHFDI